MHVKKKPLLEPHDRELQFLCSFMCFGLVFVVEYEGYGKHHFPGGDVGVWVVSSAGNGKPRTKSDLKHPLDVHVEKMNFPLHCRKLGRGEPVRGKCGSTKQCTALFFRL